MQRRTSTSATTRRTPRWPTPRAGRRASAGGCSSRGGEQLRLAVLRRRPNEPYVDYDFTPDAPQSGDEFNCFGPTNDSRNNTGLRRLPPVEQPEVWYSLQHGARRCSRSCSRTRPATGSGRWAARRMMFDSSDHARRSGSRARSTGQPLFYEWTRDYVEGVRAEPPARRTASPVRSSICSAARRARTPTSSWTTRWTWSSARTNALYTLEYGTGYFAELPAAQLARIDFVRGGQYTPVVRASANPASGTDGAADGPVLERRHDGPRRRPPVATRGTSMSDGTVDSTPGQPVVYLHARAASTRPRCGVTDSDRPLRRPGRPASRVGNQAPRVALTVRQPADRRSTSATRSPSR